MDVGQDIVLVILGLLDTEKHAGRIQLVGIEALFGIEHIRFR